MISWMLKIWMADGSSAVSMRFAQGILREKTNH